MGRAEQRSIVAKVRVYELAKEFGVESKVVMTKLEEMGEFVRSASSTIEAPVVRKLKESLNSGSAKPGRGDGGPAAGGPAVIPSVAPSAPSAPATSAGAPGAGVRPGPRPGPPRPVPSVPSVPASDAPVAPAAPAP